MKTAIVRAKVEPELKREAEAILKTIGLSTARAINLLLHQIVLTKGLPLELYIPSERVENNIRAALAGRKAEVCCSADEVLETLSWTPCSQESSLKKPSKRHMKGTKKQATI